jgi:putative nucleotidyltransferase with HDIG domain
MATTALTAERTLDEPSPLTFGERAAPRQVAPGAIASIVENLRQFFGAEFHVIDGHSGEVLRAATPAPRDLALYAEICREIVRQGRVDFIGEAEPLVMLAIPLTTEYEKSVVAVAPFVLRMPTGEAEAAEAAGLLGLQPAAALEWMRRQTCWSAVSLLRIGEALMGRHATQRRVEYLEREVENLSLHLSTTYEEISLLYRLTKNLQLSKRDEEIGALALDWLTDVMPVEGLAIQLAPVAEPNSTNYEARTEPVFFSHGGCPLDSAEFGRMVEFMRARKLVVYNRAHSNEQMWPFPTVRQCVIAPLCEGNNIFGWVAAFNHLDGGEFGTVEASLLSSVGAILGIHSGNTELYRQQNEFLAGVVRALTSAIDAKDPYTCGHSDRVARVAVRLAQELGCDTEQLDTIYLSGLLHDIGKIGIDDNVLRKPGKLTDEEYEHIKTHAEIGYKILVDLKQLDDVLPVVLHHHEQWDGGGYPRGLAGEQIPLLARIAAVADAYDAMGSDRPYRKGMPDQNLDAILRDGAGRQWDAEVVAAFFRAREDIRDISRRERASLTLDVQQWS